MGRREDIEEGRKRKRERDREREIFRVFQPSINILANRTLAVPGWKLKLFDSCSCSVNVVKKWKECPANSYIF